MCEMYHSHTNGMFSLTEMEMEKTEFGKNKTDFIGPYYNNIMLLKSLGSVRFFYVFKEVYSHQGCIYLIKKNKKKTFVL